MNDWIVVVDDDLASLKTAGVILSESGMRVTALNSGQALLELMDAQKVPDLILLDILMPGMGGLETLRRLRSREEERGSARTPVLFLTADDDEETEKKGLAAGALGLVRKPFSPDALVRRIKDILRDRPDGSGSAADADRARQTWDMQRLNGLLDEKNVGGHALWLSEEAFGDIYRYMLRYIRRYREKAYKLLFTLAPCPEAIPEEAFLSAAERFGEVVQHALRNSDIMMRCAPGQFFLLLPMVAEADIQKVVDRILGIFEKSEEGKVLSVSCEREAIAPEENGNGQERPWTAPHILVVDDDLANLKDAGAILSGEGMRVTAVNSGQAMLDHVAKERPDLILLDVVMPGMDGFEAFERLRETERAGEETPVIFLTASDDEDSETRGLTLGAMDFIKKPFIPQVLSIRVRHSIDLIRLQRHLSIEVDRKTSENEQLFLQVVKSLADAIDAKDTYTNGHSGRVAAYSQEIARRYGYSEKAQEDIYMIGLLHDVGKIGVPDEVINKPSRLTDEEFALIRTHPVMGARILENIESMPKLSSGARWHHERFGGGGYPDGLVGKAIPEEARIIAVADAYDAMTSNRSYREVMPQEKVREQIEKGKGTQFDPEFADIMLAMIDEDCNYTMREHKRHE